MKFIKGNKQKMYAKFKKSLVLGFDKSFGTVGITRLKGGSL